MPTIAHLVRRFMDRLLRGGRHPFSVAEALAGVLERPHADRDVKVFLRRHDYLVGLALGRSESPRGVLADFAQDSAWACDFVVLGCAPAWWDITLVHLDSPKVRHHQQNGRPTHAFETAAQRLAAWCEGVAANRPLLRALIARAIAPLGLPPSSPDSGGDAAREIVHTDCAVSFQSCIVLGRREPVPPLPLHRRKKPDPALASWIATYDDLLDAARRFDDADVLQRQSWEFWKGG